MGQSIYLWADPEVFGGVRSYYDEYVCDVSLLGQLYKSEYSDLCGGLSMYNRGYLEGIIAKTESDIRWVYNR